jgi:hypothetical protein
MKSSLSPLVEAATQQEFLARGRASLAEAKRTGEFYPLHEVLDLMRARLTTRMAKASRNQRLGDHP